MRSEFGELKIMKYRGKWQLLFHNNFVFLQFSGSFYVLSIFLVIWPKDHSNICFVVHLAMFETKINNRRKKNRKIKSKKAQKRKDNKKDLAHKTSWRPPMKSNELITLYLSISKDLGLGEVGVLNLILFGWKRLVVG